MLIKSEFHVLFYRLGSTPAYLRHTRDITTLDLEITSVSYIYILIFTSIYAHLLGNYVK